VKKIACFDFDGTITYSDTLLPFILFCFGKSAVFKFFLEAPILCRFIMGLSSRQATKERILGRFFGGMDVEEFQALGKRFAEEKLASLTKKQALEAIQEHKKNGHRLILISASIETYLIPWAKMVGFDDVLASKLQVPITGKLAGKNCRAEEKVRRLEELLGNLKDYEIYAYGDSRGDKELLEVATHPFYRRFT